MRSVACSFFAGVLSFHTLAELPSGWWTLGLPAALLIAWRAPALRIPAWVTAGFLWTLLVVAPPPRMQLPQAQLPSDLESVDLRVTGWIAAIPETLYRRTRFLLMVEALNHETERLAFQGRLRLSWYDAPPALQVGDKWTLTVRLKRNRGLANPGAFDYERWLFTQRIAAQGYVRSRPTAQLLTSADRYPLDRLRQRVAERFARLLPGNAYTGILTALAIGESRSIPDWQWEILTRTGTGHLISISGLHVSLIAGLLFAAVRYGWSRFPWLLHYRPASPVAAVTALLGACGYALLAGLSLPTQRAVIMLSVALLAVLGRRPVVPSRVLALALLAVLIVDPLAPLSGGFWLSFGAVAVILFSVIGPMGNPRPLRAWVGLQLRITLALLPVVLVVFQQVSLLSPVANLIAIPWSSLTVIPLTLLAVLAGLVSEILQTELLKTAGLAMDWLWRFLVWLEGNPWASLAVPAPPLWSLVFALPGLVLLLSPRGMPGRWLGAVLCLPLLLAARPAPAPGGAWLTLLDVGRGLAVVVRTARHVLIYDTGPRRSLTFDAGRVALVPFLQQQGVGRVDTLMVSHADWAHMGGTRSLLEAVETRRILTPFPLQTPIQGAETCRAGLKWQWDGVQFRILHPSENSALHGDDASCVLLVQTAGGRILLPGDIAAAGAAALVETYGEGLAAEVLVAPQQGAGTPLPQAFLSAVNPRVVLFSNGHDHRAGTPKPATLAYYQSLGARVFDTAD
jgi:competence protein ComEC